MHQTAVIFDMDGVIVASGPAHAASWKLVARKHGITISDATFRETFGRPSRDIVRIIWGEHVTDDEIKRIDDEKEAAYRDLIRGMIPLSIGVREALAGLHAAGHAMAVATSGPRENVELVLNESGLATHFAATVTGFDVQHGKPAPDCFLLAAERIGIEPARCVVIEDAPVGVEAGVAAGMPVVGYIGTWPAERLREAGATVTIPMFRELTPQLVQSLMEGRSRSR